jgi:hypothetical protein
LLKPGREGKAKIIVKGRGKNLALPTLPLNLPLRVQLQADSGACWEATYSEAGVKRNTARGFKGKAN